MPDIEIDPRVVREVAEAAFRSADGGSPAERVEAALIAFGVAGPVVGEMFDAYSAAVGAEYERLVTRKVARAAMELAATRQDDLDVAIRRLGGLGDMPEEPTAKAEYRKAYGALYSAAKSDMKAAAVTVSWPDEQDAGLAEAVLRLKRWLIGRQAHVHSEISSTNVIAEPRDRSTASWAIAESDMAAVVVALEARIARAGEQR